MNSKKPVSRLLRGLAMICENCPVCRTAGKYPQGKANQFVQKVEKDICPFCRAYEKVHGRPPHNPR